MIFYQKSEHSDTHFLFRYLRYEKLGVKEFCLQDHKEAIEMLKKGEITKVMFKPT